MGAERAAANANSHSARPFGEHGEHAVGVIGPAGSPRRRWFRTLGTGSGVGMDARANACWS